MEGTTTNQQHVLSAPYISVDVETAGPYPMRYSMLSIGACLVQNPDVGFYIELQPLSMETVPDALAISGLSMEALAERGTHPREAMQGFADWIERVIPPRQRPIFVALNAPFDWMFVNVYFHHFLDHNPFGHSALDIKAFHMGLTGGLWQHTSMAYLSPRYLGGQTLSHNALQDARDQARIFAAMLKDAGGRHIDSEPVETMGKGKALRGSSCCSDRDTTR